MKSRVLTFIAAAHIIHKYSVETMSIYINTQEIKMLAEIINRAKSMFNSFSKPQTYGSALEAYIVSNNPQNEGDIDRLMREFDAKMSNRSYGGFPC